MVAVIFSMFFIKKLLFSFSAFIILTFTAYTYSQPHENDKSNSTHQETDSLNPFSEEENLLSASISDSSKENNLHVILKGDVPSFEFPHLQQQSDSIWSFIKETINISNIAPPIIYFSPFDKKSQDEKLTSWQMQWASKNPFIWIEYIRYKKLNSSTITPEWIEDFIKHSYPFPKHFIAFHYDNTNYIQINPKRAFLAYYQNDPYGVKKDIVGLGFYIMGHEMLHYAFQEKNIFSQNQKIHHCLFILPLLPNKKSVLEALSDYLIARQFSFSAIKTLGLQNEKKHQPCKNIENLPSLQEATALKLKDTLVDLDLAEKHTNI